MFPQLLLSRGGSPWAGPSRPLLQAGIWAGIEKLPVADYDDMPWRLVKGEDGKFVLLTEMRDLGPTELELLRRAYVAIMGG